MIEESPKVLCVGIFYHMYRGGPFDIPVGVGGGGGGVLEATFVKENNGHANNLKNKNIFWP